MDDNHNGELHFTLTDDLWDDVAALEGTGIASLVVWDSSLVDDSQEEPVTDENRLFVDFELYLANQTLLELYGAAILPDEDSDAIIGLDAIGEALTALADEGAFIEAIFADQNDRLVLALATESGAGLLVFVTAWIESVWETLPDEDDE